MTSTQRLLLLFVALAAATPMLWHWSRRGDAAPVPKPNPRAEPPDSEELVVEVRGRRFQWHFRVARGGSTPNGSSRVAQVPVGRPVRWRITSEDFIYPFRIRELGVNRTAVPGLVVEALTTAKQPQTIELMVEPMCGFRLFHDDWMGRVEIGGGATRRHREDPS